MTPYEQLEHQVGDLHKVNRMIQAELSEVSATLVMLVNSFNKIMSNQNNMNLRLLSQQEQVDSIEKDLYVRVKALEERQDPSRHNNVVPIRAVVDSLKNCENCDRNYYSAEQPNPTCTDCHGYSHWVADISQVSIISEDELCTDCDECDLSCEEDEPA